MTACAAPASAVRDRVRFADARSPSLVARLRLAPAQELMEDTASSVVVPDATGDACGSDQSCMAPQLCEPVAQVRLVSSREEPDDNASSDATPAAGVNAGCIDVGTVTEPVDAFSARPVAAISSNDGRSACARRRRRAFAWARCRNLRRGFRLWADSRGTLSSVSRNLLCGVLACAVTVLLLSSAAPG